MCPFTVMPDYQKGKIYRIWDNAFTKCYIGSTVEPLSKRMTKHREKYNAYLRPKYPFTTSFALFDDFGFENCKIELLENFPVTVERNSLQEKGTIKGTKHVLAESTSGELKRNTTTKTMKHVYNEAGHGGNNTSNTNGTWAKNTETLTRKQYYPN